MNPRDPVTYEALREEVDAAQKSDAGLTSTSTSAPFGVSVCLQKTPLEGIYALPGSFPLRSLPSYTKGRVIGMDLASMLSVFSLRIKPGEHVLDLCCAPGAKLGLVADLLEFPKLLKPSVLSDAVAGSHGSTASSSSSSVSSNPTSTSSSSTSPTSSATSSASSASSSASSASSSASSASSSSPPSPSLPPFLHPRQQPWDSIAGGSVTGVDVSLDRLNICKKLFSKHGVRSARLFATDGCWFDSPPLHAIDVILARRMEPVWRAGILVDEDSITSNALPPTHIDLENKAEEAGHSPKDTLASSSGSSAGSSSSSSSSGGSGINPRIRKYVGSANTSVNRLLQSNVHPGSNGSRSSSTSSDHDIPIDVDASLRTSTTFSTSTGTGAGTTTSAGLVLGSKRFRRHLSSEEWKAEANHRKRMRAWAQRVDAKQTTTTAITTNTATTTTTMTTTMTSLPSSSPASLLSTTGATTNDANSVPASTITTTSAPTSLLSPASTLILYDKVLVDAECTHDGSHKHVGKFGREWSSDSLARRVLDPARLPGLFLLQSKLLENGFRMLAPGGLLVYSTCSFARAQNEDVAARFLALHHQDACCVPVDLSHVGLQLRPVMRGEKKEDEQQQQQQQQQQQRGHEHEQQKSQEGSEGNHDDGSSGGSGQANEVEKVVDNIIWYEPSLGAPSNIPAKSNASSTSTVTTSATTTIVDVDVDVIDPAILHKAYEDVARHGIRLGPWSKTSGLFMICFTKVASRESQ